MARNQNLAMAVYGVLELLFDIAEGVSSNAGYQELQNKERSQVLHALFTPLVVDALLGASKFEQRILYALTKEKKWKRDLKMLRNLLKVIPVDFFHYIFGGRK